MPQIAPEQVDAFIALLAESRAHLSCIDKRLILSRLAAAMGIEQYEEAFLPEGWFNKTGQP